MNEEERQRHVKQMRLNAMRRSEAQNESADGEETAIYERETVFGRIGIFGIWVLATTVYIPVYYLLVHPHYFDWNGDISTIDSIKQSDSFILAMARVILAQILFYLYFAVAIFALLVRGGLHFSMMKFCLFSAFSLFVMLILDFGFQMLIPDVYFSDEPTASAVIFALTGYLAVIFLGLAIGFRIVMGLGIKEIFSITLLTMVLFIVSVILLELMLLAVDHPRYAGS